MTQGKSDIAPGGVVRSPAQCIALHSASAGTSGFSWCRIDDCASGGGAGAITNLQELVQGAVDENTVGSGALDGLVDTFHFRKNAKGEVYADVDTFKTAFKEAVADLIAHSSGVFTSENIANTITWKQLQYALDHPGTDCYKSEAEVAATCDYWWEPDSNGVEGKKEIPDLATLLDVGWKVYEQDYDSSWLDGLNLSDVTAADKINIWANDNKDSHNFADVDTFKTKLETVITTLKDSGHYTDANIKDVPWVEVQNLFLENTYETATNLEAGSAKLDMWWGYDAPTFTESAPTLSELIFAAQVAHKGSETAWDNLTNEILKKLHLYKADPGGAAHDTESVLTPFDISVLTDQKAFTGAMERLLVEVIAAGKDPAGKVDGTTDPVLGWREIQHALFNGGIYEPDPSKIDTNYTYWWQADGSGTRPAVLTTLKEMLQAAVSSTGVTGSTPNPNAWKTLQADAVNKLFLAKADLPEDQRKAGDGFSKLEHFASDNLDEFKNLMEALVQNAYAAGIVDPTELSWLQTQDGLFNGGVYNASPVGETYWWTEQGDGLRPGEVRFDPDEVIKELLVEASTINRKWTGESVRGDDAKLQEQIAKYLDQLKLKKKPVSGVDQGFYSGSDAADVTEISKKLDTLATLCYGKSGKDGWEDFLSALVTDGGYAQMTWKQVQAYLMGAGVKADSALNDGDYSWKPSSISESNTISIAGNVEDIIATVQEVLSEDERTKTKSDNCTQVVTDTGDTIIDIENIIESKCGIRFLGCDSILRISYKTVVKNHIEVEGFSHQAAAKATTEKSGWNLQWISITEDPELVIIEMLLPEGLQLAEVQQEAEVTDLEEIFQPGTGEKVDTPVETTEPETESPTPESTDSPEPETSQKPTEETIEPEPSEPTTETPIPEETQKPTETTEPTEPETPSAAQTQKPDGTTATENEEKTPTDGNAGAAEGTQTTDAEETKAPAEETGGSATELPKDETAEVLAVAWVLPPEVLASRAGQASSVQRC